MSGLVGIVPPGGGWPIVNPDALAVAVMGLEHWERNMRARSPVVLDSPHGQAAVATLRDLQRLVRACDADAFGCVEVATVDESGPPPAEWLQGTDPVGDLVGVSGQRVRELLTSTPPRLRGRKWRGTWFVDPASLPDEFGDEEQWEQRREARKSRTAA